MSSAPKGEHGSRGTFSGILTGGGILQVLHEYTIEGSNQTEEEVLKLDGDRLDMTRSRTLQLKHYLDMAREFKNQNE